MVIFSIMFFFIIYNRKSSFDEKFDITDLTENEKFDITDLTEN
jgi:hypothetical protein